MERNRHEHRFIPPALLIAACLAAALYCTPVSAEDLYDLTDSASFQDLERRNGAHAARNYRGDWVVPGENYSKLFADRGSAALLNTWIGIYAEGYKVREEDTVAAPKFVFLRRVYENIDGVRFELQVLVPHPRNLMEAKMGLLDDLNSFEPPALPAVSEQQVEIKGRSAKLFKKADRSCSVLIKFPKSAVINLKGPCSQKTQLLSLAAMLSLDRFEKMLTS